MIYRRRHLRKMSTNVGPNMTPMVDVVLCILIFFMLGASFVSPELFLTSNMAAVEKGGIGTESGDRKLPSVLMTIALRREAAPGSADHTTVSAFDSPFMPMDTRLDPNQHFDESQNNARIMALLTAKRKTISDDVQVIILPDKNVPYQDVITIYDYCTKLQFKQVAFAAAR